MYIDRPIRQPEYARILRALAASRQGVRVSLLESKPAWVSLGPPLLFAAGVGVVAWDYALRPVKPLNYSWFWVGMVLCLLAVLSVGLRRQVSATQRVLALVAIGAATYMPYVLRSPARLIFSDELYHYQVTQLMIELGNRDLPVTNYPIPGEFPGLEFVTMSLMGTTGLSLDAATRVVTMSVHMLIPALLYMIARGIGLGKRTGFVAAVVYITNTSYFFFHSVFSYETLGIALVLAVWALIGRSARVGLSKRDLALVAPVLFALAVTHHVSSYLLAISLVIAWLTKRVFAKRISGTHKRDLLGAAALLSIIFPAIWLVIGTERTVRYLSTSIGLRVQAIVDTIFAEQTASRGLFKTSPLPQLERLVDYAYAPLLLMLGLGGLYLIWRHGKWRRATPLLLSLAVFGPALWAVSAPAILTRSADMIYRSWPFLFIGMGMYCALALVRVLNWSPARLKPAGVLLATGALTILFVGGISLGDNQAGRFNSDQVTQVAGPEAITADVVTAARWLEQTAGRYNLLAGDASTETTFATYGYQRNPGWDNWTPFLAKSPAQVDEYLRVWHTGYIVVDQRITKYLPRYQYYFGQAEVLVLQQQGYSTDHPFPAELAAKFDYIDQLSRTYDNGNIRIYRAGGAVPASSTQPGDNPTVSNNGNR